MPKPSSYTISALEKRHPVFRRQFDKPEFMRRILWVPDRCSETQEFATIAMLPRNAFELEAMSMTVAFDLAKVVVLEQNLVLPTSDSTTVHTIGELKAEAIKAFPDVKSVCQHQNLFANTHFGRPYSVLLSNLKKHLIQRFETAFDSVLAIPVDNSSRTRHERQILSGLECWADEATTAEMVDIANEGHVYANWVAGLLLTSERPLTDVAVGHLLKAHDGKFPHALTNLAELLLVEGFFVDALEAALLALDAGAPLADLLIDRITEFTTGMVVIDGGPNRPLMYALVHEVISPDFHALAMKHRPQWRESTHAERERDALVALSCGVPRG